MKAANQESAVKIHLLENFAYDLKEFTDEEIKEHVKALTDEECHTLERTLSRVVHPAQIELRARWEARWDAAKPAKPTK